MSARLRRAAAAAGLLAACGGARALTVDLAPLQPGLDYHSYANTDQFKVTHLQLELRVDLDNKEIDGVVALQLKRLDPSATQLVLDTRDLLIQGVSQKATDLLGATAKAQQTWVSRPFHLNRADPILGSALVIDLPPSRKTTEIVKIEYETSPGAAALQWLAPKQTPGRGKAFLYTQGQAIQTRSWIPLQDTPEIRASYSAVIHTSADAVALMSAKNDPKHKRNGEYRFDMLQAVPSYLIALAVGDFQFKQIGPRTGVYAEAKILNAAAAEFVDLENMLTAAEAIGGPYRWDRCDLLVMPQSFPAGGAGNPELAFVSPTLIAGDKGLIEGAAHEIAHAWAGSLVGNSTWRDLWLNEGLAGYLESRVMRTLYGEPRALMGQVLAFDALKAELARRAPAQQILAIDLRGQDPLLLQKQIPYQKGRLFFEFLEARFGRARLDEFLRGYFDHFAFGSLDTEQFLAYLGAHLLEPNPGLVSEQEVRDWVHAPGLANTAVLPQRAVFAAIDTARSKWLAGEVPLKTLAVQWNTPQRIYFLQGLQRPLSAAQLADLDHLHLLGGGGNAVIEDYGLELAVRNDYRPAFVGLEAFLQDIGRLSLLEPLYLELLKTPAGSALAKRVYAKARPNYHSSTAAAIDALLIADGEEEAQ